MGLIDQAAERLREERLQKQEAGAGRSQPPSGGEARPDEPRAVSGFHRDEPGPPPREDEPETYTRFSLPIAMLKKKGMLIGKRVDPRLRDEYQRIKRALMYRVSLTEVEDVQQSETTTPPNLVMITSAVGEEGKTFMATNLAFSLNAEVDRGALLVDGDIIRRGASRLLGAEEGPGLLEWLAGEVEDPTELILQPTQVPNLLFLPAGQPRASASELVASARTERCLEALARRFSDRVVLIDAPPLLPTSEATVFARLVRHVVTVVRADRTRREEVEEAVAMIEEDRFAGFILNRATRRYGVEAYGGYAGSYGNGKSEG